MGRPFAALFATRSRWFDVGVLAAGILLFLCALAAVVLDGSWGSPAYLLSIPLIIVIAGFPMLLDNGDGGIEVGFDSSILMFLLCVMDEPQQALVLWALGVLLTQVTSEKRTSSKVFNIGLGVLG